VSIKGKGETKGETKSNEVPLSMLSTLSLSLHLGQTYSSPKPKMNTTKPIERVESLEEGLIAIHLFLQKHT
jgi:hypothetical protein